MNNRAAVAVMTVFLLIAVLFGNPVPAVGSPSEALTVVQDTP